MPFEKMIIIDRDQAKGYGAKIVDHFIKLSHTSNRHRFFNYRSEEILREWVHALAHQKTEIEHFWILIFKNNKIISVGQLSLDKDHLAEIAISVSDKYQDNGIGKVVLDQLIKLAKNHLVKTLVLSCYSENHRMISLASNFGFKLTPDHSEINGVLDLSQENYSNEEESNRESSA